MAAGCTSAAEPRVAGPDLQVGYAGAAQRLAGMDPLEGAEQKRDWLRLALAAHLELDTGQLRDQSYDTLPLRDEGFTDLARQPVGPGRALLDGAGVLHVLAPDGDQRAVGLLLDQHRADAGADPAQVRVHHYTDHADTATADIRSGPPTATAEARASLGYVETRVDGGQGLADFLGRARHLSTLEVRDGQVWAGGWTWPNAGAALSAADVSVLHRAYTAGDRPGFSLDPVDPTVDGLLAALPEVDPALAKVIVDGGWAGTEFGSAEEFAGDIDHVLFDNGSLGRLADYGITADRTQLWALLNAAEGRPFSSEARYDGGLAGTEVGMTLFYTDYIAKDWTAGVGDGVPADAVEGFTPKTQAPTAWSHCGDTAAESGRLWFGQNDAAFAFHDGRVDIGAQATRLFTRSDADGGEIESSYAFGGALRWWDRHYQAVADYEPQYSRLEQLMRWSAALEWLVGTTEHRLRLVEPGEVATGLSYADWYADHDDLRERGPLRMVAGADPEELLPQPSQDYTSCGRTWLGGGVSLGDVLARKGERAYRADLPAPANRAGLVDESSTLDSNGGTIKNPVLDDRGAVTDVVTREVASTADGAATVATTAGGRAVAPLGGLKVWLAKAVGREVGTDLRAGGGSVEQNASFHGHDLGGLRAQKNGRTVTVSWRTGVIDRARSVLADIQARMTTTPSATLAAAGGRVLYSHKSAGGTTLHRVGGGEEPWLAITADLGPPGDSLALRLGVPRPDDTPAFYHGTFTAGPGPPSRWMTVTPGETAVLSFSDTPPSGSPVTVSMKDGRTGRAHPDSDRWSAATDDPVLGLRGPVEGAALLRDMPRVHAAMKDAAGDGIPRAVVLGQDGVALATPEGIQLLSPTDPWTARVLAAVGPDLTRVPLTRVIDDRLVHVVPDGLRGPAEPYTASLADVLATADAVYFHNQFRADLSLSEGTLLADALPLDATVTVRPALMAEEPRYQFHTQPDARTDFGATWWRVDGRVATTGNGQPTTTASAPPTSSTPPGASQDIPGSRVLLVCPEDTDDLAGCS
ncbi:hypothetical protein ACTG9Q_05700 [Actinokineospora sp. 24-640]